MSNEKPTREKVRQLVRCPCGKSWISPEKIDREFAELKCQNESLIREVERLREREKYDHFPHTPKDWPT